MSIEVLISTIGEGIYNVPDMFLPMREDVCYLVSWQVDDLMMYKEVMLLSCFSRKDVRLYTMKGRGLSRNRNNCLARATGDILLFADDDCRYTDAYLDNLRQASAETDADVLLMQSSLRKAYPGRTLPLADARRHRGYYPSSVEMAVRRTSIGALRFNEDFGLGSGRYVCGEEDVFLKDAATAGLKIVFTPRKVTDTPDDTTGRKFLEDSEVQKAKGATFRYVYPPLEAEWRIVKEVLHHWLCSHANPVELYESMRGKTGNPGNPGNPGNAGNAGSAGSAGHPGKD